MLTKKVLITPLFFVSLTRASNFMAQNHRRHNSEATRFHTNTITCELFHVHRTGR
jgi:hypothetical protein